MIANVPGGLRSWGETVEVRVSKRPDGKTAVEVNCSAGAQIFAWGKPGENIEAFFRALDGLLARGEGAST